MPIIEYDFDWPDRVVVGTVGSPGSRAFYLQVRTGNNLMSIAMEKQQAAALAERIDEILDLLMAREGNPFGIPTVTPVELVDNDALEHPVAEDFRAGYLNVSWDSSTRQIVIETHPIVQPEDHPIVDDDDDDDDDDGEEPHQPREILLVRMPVGTSRAFAKRTREVVGAGRPFCALCGDPIDPGGHVCTRPGGP